jgi:hypothetical protein
MLARIAYGKVIGRFAVRSAVENSMLRVIAEAWSIPVRKRTILVKMPAH